MTSEDILKSKIEMFKLINGPKAAKRLEKAYRNFCSTSLTLDTFEVFKAGFVASYKKPKRK